MRYLRTGSGIAFYWKGESYTLNTSELTPIINRAIQIGHPEALLLAANPKEFLAVVSEGQHKVEAYQDFDSSAFSIDGIKMSRHLNKRITAHLALGLPLEPILLYWEKILEFPMESSIDFLTRKLESEERSLTAKGELIGYAPSTITACKNVRVYALPPEGRSFNYLRVNLNPQFVYLNQGELHWIKVEEAGELSRREQNYCPLLFYPEYTKNLFNSLLIDKEVQFNN